MATGPPHSKEHNIKITKRLGALAVAVLASASLITITSPATPAQAWTPDPVSVFWQKNGGNTGSIWPNTNTLTIIDNVGGNYGLPYRALDWANENGQDNPNIYLRLITGTGPNDTCASRNIQNDCITADDLTYAAPSNNYDTGIDPVNGASYFRGPEFSADHKYGFLSVAPKFTNSTLWADKITADAIGGHEMSHVFIGYQHPAIPASDPEFDSYASNNPDYSFQRRVTGSNRTSIANAFTGGSTPAA